MVRHCEAMGNVLRLFQGTSDFGISELGAKQLKFLTSRFENVNIDVVYSSPLLRAKKTALAVIGDKNLNMICEEGLAEICGGVLEGKPFAESMRQIGNLAQTWDEAPHEFDAPEGEPMKDAYNRIWETVLKIAKANKGKTVACATHGGVLRCLSCRILHNDITKLKGVPWHENTAISLIRFDDDFNPEFIIFNDTSHLPQELVNKKSRIASIER